jgi:hypothetical protein
MTKRDLLKRYEQLLEEKGLYKIDGITVNSRKEEIQNAINCLECSDEKLDEYAIIIKLKYPNTFRRIIENPTNFKEHPFNRLYVFNIAENILA